MLNDPILWPTPSLLVTWEWKLRWEIRVCISWTVSWSNFFFPSCGQFLNLVLKVEKG